MSTDYTETLKKIKDIEEATGKELLERRRALEEELRLLEEEAAVSIEEAKRKGEAHVSEEVEKAHRSAQKEADSLNSETTARADSVATRKLDKKQVKKIVEETLFSEFE